MRTLPCITIGLRISSLVLEEFYALITIYWPHGRSQSSGRSCFPGKQTDPSKEALILHYRQIRFTPNLALTPMLSLTHLHMKHHICPIFPTSYINQLFLPKKPMILQCRMCHSCLVLKHVTRLKPPMPQHCYKRKRTNEELKRFLRRNTSNRHRIERSCQECEN